MDYNLQDGGPTINPNADTSAPDRKAPYVQNGTEVLDPARYYDAAFARKEWDRMWTRVWTIAGIVADIPEVGDYIKYDLLHESFIVTRVGEGAEDIKAYFNVCGHRGNQLVMNDLGSVTDGFTCAFHSWRWSINGELQHVTDAASFQPEVLERVPSMAEVHVGIVAGIIFINMDDNPPPLRDFLGVVADHMESFEVDKMHVARHVRTEWAANWKTGIDAFYETYHLHAVHPETQGVMADIDVQYDCYPNGMSRMIVPIGAPSPRVPDQESVNEGLAMMLAEVGIDPVAFEGNAADVQQAIRDKKRENAKTVGLDYDNLADTQLTDSFATGIFPNVQFGMHPEGAFLMRFMPHPTEPERFTYDTMTLVRYVDDPNFSVPGWMGLPEGIDCTGAIRPDIEHKGIGEPPELGLVLDQDSELLPVVQRGIRSRGFAGALWGEQEQRLRHFHNELDRYVDGENSPAIAPRTYTIKQETNN